jgi:hypothetical protein
MLIRLCRRLTVDVHLPHERRGGIARVSLPRGQLLPADPDTTRWAGGRYRVPLPGGPVVFLPRDGWKWEWAPPA